MPDRDLIDTEPAPAGSADSDVVGPEATSISGDYATGGDQPAPGGPTEEAADPVGRDNIAQGLVGGRMGTAHPSEGQGQGG